LLGFCLTDQFSMVAVIFLALFLGVGVWKYEVDSLDCHSFALFVMASLRNRGWHYIFTL